MSPLSQWENHIKTLFAAHDSSNSVKKGKEMKKGKKVSWGF